MYFSDIQLVKRDGINHFRIPSVVVTKKGTVLVFFNNRLNTLEDHAIESTLVLCRKESEKAWEAPRTIASHANWAYRIDSAVYDEQTETAICLFRKILKPLDEFGNYTEEERRRIQETTIEDARKSGIEQGHYAAMSRDEGITWDIKKVSVSPNTLGFTGLSHGSSTGITLKFSPYAGRLLCPARYITGTYSDREGLKTFCYNAAIYSDDHGMTWQTSLPVQAGTGEGTLAELSNGRIYYNSRAYFNDNARYIAYSDDGGVCFDSFDAEPQLLEPVFGCNASLLRVTYKGDTVLLFANPRHPTDRVDMTVSVSFDEGKTWQVAKCISHNPSAYSSLAYSYVDDRYYLIYESGQDDPYEGLQVAEFDTEWLLYDIGKK